MLKPDFGFANLPYNEVIAITCADAQETYYESDFGDRRNIVLEMILPGFEQEIEHLNRFLKNAVFESDASEIRTAQEVLKERLYQIDQAVRIIRSVQKAEI